jgi:hypothetical protein
MIIKILSIFRLWSRNSQRLKNILVVASLHTTTKTADKEWANAAN